MNKTIKILSMLVIAIVLLTVTLPVFADNDVTSTLNTLENKIGEPDENVTNKTEGVAKIAARIIKLIRNAAVILAVVLISVLGIKYMMGSAEEKSGYQKSFIPLIVGIVVVLAAMQIATMLFSLAD